MLGRMPLNFSWSYVLDIICVTLPHTAGDQQEACSVQPTCSSLWHADTYQTLLHTLPAHSPPYAYVCNIGTCIYCPWDPSICFLSFHNRYYLFSALIQKKAGLASSSRWERDCVACHGQLTKGGNQSNSCMQINSSHHFVTNVSQQMPQVIMQLRAMLLEAIIKYGFYLTASSSCLVVYEWC